MSSPPSPNEVNEETDHDANDDVNVNDNVTNNTEVIYENEVSSNINLEEFINAHAMETATVEFNEDDNINNGNTDINEGNTNAVQESEAIAETDNLPQQNLSESEMLYNILETEVNNFIAEIESAQRIESEITATNDSNSNNYSPEPVNMPNEQQQEEENQSTNKIEVLLCAECNYPIASNREILRARADDAWRDQVYCYELDLFENEKPVWAYSATNPSSVRFDVVRISPYIHTECRTMPSSSCSTEVNKPNEVIDKTLHKDDVQLTNNINTADNNNNPDESVVQVNTCITTISNKEINKEDNTATDKEINRVIESRKVNDGISCVFTRGAYSSEHPFFVGYDWCFCHCINCGSFLGWGFAKHDKVIDAMRTIEEEKAHAQNEKENNRSRRKKQRKMEQISNSNNNNTQEESAIASAAADAMRRYEEDTENDNYEYETHSGAYNTLVNTQESETFTENNYSNNNDDAEEEIITEEQHVETVNSTVNTAIQSNEEEEHSELTAVNDHAHSEQQEENQEDIDEEENDDDEEEEEWQGEEEDLLRQTNEEKVKTMIRQMEKIARQRKSFHTTPTPDFIGLIVTRCTGTNDYDAKLYNKAQLLANGTLTKHFIITYFDKEFRRLLNSLHDYRLTHTLYNKFLKIKSIMHETWRLCEKAPNDNSNESASHPLTDNVNVETDNFTNLHVNTNQEGVETHEYIGSREEANIASTTAGDIAPELSNSQNEEMEKENNKSKESPLEETETEALDVWVKSAINALQDFYVNSLNIINRWTSNGGGVQSYSRTVNNGILSLFSTASLLTLLTALEDNEQHDEEYDSNNNNTNNEENGNNDVNAYAYNEADLQEVGEEPLISHSLSEEHHQQHNVNIETNNDEDTLISNDSNRIDSDEWNTSHTPLSAVSSNDSSQSFDDLF